MKEIMELRSQRAKESKDLQATLMNLGFYEDGMDLSEMRNMMSALQESVNETDVDRAVKENDVEWNEEGQLFSSTTIQQYNATASQNNTSEIDTANSECRYDVVVTQAIVHHSMNWSPNNHSQSIEHNNKKILCSSRTDECNHNNTNNRNDNNTTGVNDMNTDDLDRRPMIVSKLNDSGVNLSRELEGDASMSSSISQQHSTSTRDAASLLDPPENPLQASTSSAAVSDPPSYTQQISGRDESGEPSR